VLNCLTFCYEPLSVDGRSALFFDGRSALLLQGFLLDLGAKFAYFYWQALVF